MTSYGRVRTNQGGPEQKRDQKDEEGEGDSGKTGRVSFISGPTVCLPNTGFADGLNGESSTGHIQVFFWGGEPLLWWYLSFSLGLM